MRAARRGAAVHGRRLPHDRAFLGTARPHPRDAWAGDARFKEPFFFDPLERGQYLARRAMMALSLEIREAECRALLDAVEDFLDLRAPLLERRAD